MKKHLFKIKMFGCLFSFIFLANTLFAQSNARYEQAIYKLVPNEYAQNTKALQTSFAQVAGIEIEKVCSIYNKVFLILKVNREMHPTDVSITNKLTALSLSYKPIDDVAKPELLNSCN